MTHLTLLKKLDELKNGLMRDASTSPAQKIKSLAEILLEVEAMVRIYETLPAEGVWKQEMISYDEYEALKLEAFDKGDNMECDRLLYTTTGGKVVSEERMEDHKKDAVYTLANMRKEIMNEIRKIAGSMEKVPGLRD
jgi:hypothetical protein